MATLILHHHIFKNSGSTIDAILKNNFGRSKAICYDKIMQPGEKHYLSQEEVAAEIAKHKKIISFSSHQTHCQQFAMDGIEIVDIAMIRHPLLRLKSMHSFYLKSPALKTPLARAAQTSSFTEFITSMIDGKLLNAGNNAQTRIVGTGHREKYSKPDANTLESAKQRALSIQCLGVVEIFEQSMMYAKHVISRSLGNENLTFTASAVNQTSDIRIPYHDKLGAMEAELGTELYDAITHLNLLDIELWGFAQGILRSRIQALSYPSNDQNFSHRDTH